MRMNLVCLLCSEKASSFFSSGSKYLLESSYCQTMLNECAEPISALLTVQGLLDGAQQKATALARIDESTSSNDLFRIFSSLWANCKEDLKKCYSNQPLLY